MSSNENDEVQQPRTLRVTLADVPRDVLVHLVDHGRSVAAEIATAIAPCDLPMPVAVSKVESALVLLQDGGWALDTRIDGWEATEDGFTAVDHARAEVSS